MSIIRMSFSAGFIILVIAVIRALAINSLPKKTFLLLWGVAMCRLLIPFSISSRFSVYTLADRLVKSFSKTPNSDITALNIVIPPYTDRFANFSAPIPTEAVAAQLQPITIIWLTGMITCALFFLVTHFYNRKEYGISLPVSNDYIDRWLRGNKTKRPIQIRQSDKIKSPMTYGIWRPVILFPKTTDWQNERLLQYILSHELEHIRRFDTLLKYMLAFALCLHWFNPFVWIMYILVNRDIELSCDEAVVCTFGEAMKSAYALSLIDLEEKKSRLAPLYSYFSKNPVEERIVSIMKYKKVSVVAVAASALLIVGICIAFATSSKPDMTVETENIHDEPVSVAVDEETVYTSKIIELDKTGNAIDLPETIIAGSKYESDDPVFEIISQPPDDLQKTVNAIFRNIVADLNSKDGYVTISYEYSILNEEGKKIWYQYDVEKNTISIMEFNKALVSGEMIKTTGVNGNEGWVYAEQLQLSLLREFLRITRAYKNADSIETDYVYINLYDEDGVTVIDKYGLYIGDSFTVEY